MYEIYIDNGNGLKLFSRQGVEGLGLIDVKYKSTMGGAGSLSFTIPNNHPYLDTIYPLITLFWLYKDDKPIFRGRYVGKTEDFYKTGKLTCEGDLNFLLDSIQDPYNFDGNIKDFFETMIENHNSMVDENKRFKIGNITVVDDNNYINRSDTEYSNTLTVLQSKLIDIHGGYLRTRYEPDGVYIDYVYDYGSINKQAIRFGENLLDLSKQIDASTIITCLIPLGADLQNGEEGVSSRVDISSVNNGKKYIVNNEAVNKYGRIWGTKTWDEVDNANDLKAKATVYLQEQTLLPSKFTLTTIDLSLINSNINDFELGCWTDVISEEHGITGKYLLNEIDIDISAPQRSKLTLGGTVTTLSKAVANNNADVSRKVQQTRKTLVKWFEDAIDNATDLIRGGMGGYIVMSPNESTGYPEEILILDAPEKEKATNVIRINKNGIGFSTSGYDGVYRNAWTIDGRLCCDFLYGGAITGQYIQNKPDTEKDRLVIDQTSSLKGYNGKNLINLLNVAQTAGTTQMTIDAKNQLNVRTPKVVVEQASHGEDASTGTVCYTGLSTLENVVGKYYEGEHSSTGGFPGANPTECHVALCDPNDLNHITGTMFCTLPVYLKMQPVSIKTINGFVVGNQTGTIYPI